MRKCLILLGLLLLGGCAHSPDLTADVRITSLQDQLATARAESKHNYKFALCLGELYRYRIAHLMVERQGLLVDSCQISYDGYGRMMKSATESYRATNDDYWLRSILEDGEARKLWKSRLDEETNDLKSFKEQEKAIGDNACSYCEDQWGRLNYNVTLPQCVKDRIKEYQNAKGK